MERSTAITKAPHRMRARDTRRALQFSTRCADDNGLPLPQSLACVGVSHSWLKIRLTTDSGHVQAAMRASGMVNSNFCT